MHSDALFRLLLPHPGEEFGHLGLSFELFQGVEILGEAGVVEQGVDLPVAS